MDLWDIILNEINQNKTNTVCSQLHVKSKKPNSDKQSLEWQLPGAEELEKWGDISQRTQTSSYEMN